MQLIRIPTHVNTVFFDDSAVLLDSEKNVYYALNDSAAYFWKSITNTGSFEESIKKLMGGLIPLLFSLL
jgi:hypothetical protein